MQQNSISLYEAVGPALAQEAEEAGEDFDPFEDLPEEGEDDPEDDDLYLPEDIDPANESDDE